MKAAGNRGAVDVIELRLVGEVPGVEVREEDNGKTVCRGYAALFDSESRDFGGFVEFIERGAFDRVLADPATDVICKLDHKRPLARTPGTLRLGVDERGLWYEFDPKRADADVVEALERGDLRGSSFAFRVASGDDRWEKRDDGTTVRTITNFAGLYDVGPVYTPAYPETSSWVSKRALDMVAAMDPPVPTEDPLAGQIAEAREALLKIEVNAAIKACREMSGRSGL